MSACILHRQELKTFNRREKKQHPKRQEKNEEETEKPKTIACCVLSELSSNVQRTVLYCTVLYSTVQYRCCSTYTTMCLCYGSTSRWRDERWDTWEYDRNLSSKRLWNLSPISSVQLTRRYAHAFAVLVTFAAWFEWELRHNVENVDISFCTLAFAPVYSATFLSTSSNGQSATILRTWTTLCNFEVKSREQKQSSNAYIRSSTDGFQRWVDKYL